MLGTHMEQKLLNISLDGKRPSGGDFLQVNLSQALRRNRSELQSMRLQSVRRNLEVNLFSLNGFES